MYKSILAILFLILVSCKEDKGSIVRQNSVEISVKSISGTDLLDPLNFSSFLSNSINVLYLVDGKEQTIYRSNLDYPKMFLFYKDIASYKVRLFLDDSSDLTSTTIQWNQVNKDVIKCQYSRDNGSLYIKRIWLNDILQEGTVLNIVKNNN